MGTIRTYDAKTDEFIFEQINKIAANAADRFGCNYKVGTTDVLPVVYNDPALTERVVRSAEKVIGDGTC